MRWKLVILAPFFVLVLRAQAFIQMSDPPCMYTKDQDFEQETSNFEFAIAAANRLKPAFVVLTGDLITKVESTPSHVSSKKTT
jgi:hypothetical protein